MWDRNKVKTIARLVKKADDGSFWQLYSPQYRRIFYGEIKTKGNKCLTMMKN